MVFKHTYMPNYQSSKLVVAFLSAQLVLKTSKSSMLTYEFSQRVIGFMAHNSFPFSAHY